MTPQARITLDPVAVKLIVDVESTTLPTLMAAKTKLQRTRCLLPDAKKRLRPRIPPVIDLASP
jgi:hypothetical protein